MSVQEQNYQALCEYLRFNPTFYCGTILDVDGEKRHFAILTDTPKTVLSERAMAASVRVMTQEFVKEFKTGVGFPEEPIEIRMLRKECFKKLLPETSDEVRAENKKVKDEFEIELMKLKQK